jgi:hypothetical protein
MMRAMMVDNLQQMAVVNQSLGDADKRVDWVRDVILHLHEQRQSTDTV